MTYHIVVPTYKRPEKLQKFVASFLSQKFGDVPFVKLFIYCDNNDTANFITLSKLYDGIPNIKVVFSEKQLRAFGTWNYHLSQESCDGMFYICDDVELFPDFLEKVFSKMKATFHDTDCLIGVNQENISRGVNGFSVNAMGLIGAKFAERFINKICFCPDYVSFHADSELGNFARHVGKFAYADEAKLTHFHPVYFKNLVDSTHHVVREHTSRDREVHTKRQTHKLLWGKDFIRVV